MNDPDRYSQWDYLVFPDDFPVDRRPTCLLSDQKLIRHKDYLSAMNEFGGFIFCGATMAFATAYWTLHTLQPDFIGFIGCDMNYRTDSGNTHFYGMGTADPLRNDITLRDLTAKSARIAALGLSRGHVVFNLSKEDFTRLSFPRLDPDAFFKLSRWRRFGTVQKLLHRARFREFRNLLNVALQLESDANFDPRRTDTRRLEKEIDLERLDEIDQAWLRAGQASTQLILDAFAYTLRI